MEINFITNLILVFKIIKINSFRDLKFELGFIVPQTHKCLTRFL